MYPYVGMYSIIHSHNGIQSKYGLRKINLVSTHFAHQQFISFFKNVLIRILVDLNTTWCYDGIS